MSQEVRKIFEHIIEMGVRLRADSLTTAFASTYLHRVLRQEDFPREICPFTVAAGCMLVAGKVTSDARVNTRDVMNIAYDILHPEEPPLEIGELSYALREGLIEMELLVLRYLRFRLNFEHPHQDLILIIKLLRDFYPNTFSRHSGDIEKVAAMFLQDIYVCPQIVLDHKPKTLAIAIISMTFTALHINIPDAEWGPVLMPTLDEKHMEKIKNKILEQVYFQM